MSIFRRSTPGTGATYQYVFDHRQSFLDGYPAWVNGSHMDDIYSVLGDPFMRAFRLIYLREDFDAIDLAISGIIMNFYSNFAHTGCVKCETDNEWRDQDRK